MLHLYNTLGRRDEDFKPIKNKRVGLYTCGPTVYNYAHLGNLRTYIFEDILKRVLLSGGYKVRHVMNITDVDDKTIRDSQVAKESLKHFTARFTQYFKEDIKKLNILPPTKFAPATKYIKEMVKLIQALQKNGLAYQKDGSIYFSISKFKNYGQLSQLDKRELRAGARVDVDEYEKENPADFVLWKAWSEKDGDVFWATPLGKGRPGWHLECSAVSAAELGQPFDIHAGAVDLIFPHHENEIAQSEAAAGKKFVNYWLHGEHLLVDSQKMAKSLHNFYILRDLENKKFNPLAFRYLTLTTHYRTKLNFTWEALVGAQNALNNLYQTARSLPLLSKERKEVRLPFAEKFQEAINHDLNLPQALGILWEMIHSPLPTGEKSALVLKFDEILGLDIKKYLGKKIKIPTAIKKLLAERKLARENKDWKKSDNLRDQLYNLGFRVEDGADEQTVKHL